MCQKRLRITAVTEYYEGVAYMWDVYRRFWTERNLLIQNMWGVIDIPSFAKLRRAPTFPYILTWSPCLKTIWKYSCFTKRLTAD
jgi:hypothetical protein